MTLGTAVDWLLERLGRLPTTQLVTAVGIGAFVGTILLWWALSFLHALVPASVAAWEPSASMIAFISAWGVIAAAQFASKRVTDSGYVAAKASGPAAITTTTVSGDPATVTTTTDPKGTL